MPLPLAFTSHRSSRALVIVFLALGAPLGAVSRAEAQSTTPSVELQIPPGYEHVSQPSPSTVQTDAPWRLARASQRARQEAAGRPPRLVLQPIIGFAIGWGLSGLGILLSMVSGSCTSSDTGVEWTRQSCQIRIVTSASVGMLLGIPLGVMLAGTWFGGMGTVLSTFLGTLAGLGVAVLISAFVEDYAVRAATTLLPVAGAMVAYELSSSSNARAGLTRIALAPTIERGAVTGGIAGLSVAF